MIESTSSTRRQQLRQRLYVAAILAAFAIFFLALAPGIERTGLEGGDDPGPAFFPILLSLFLLGCAVVELAQYGRGRWRLGEDESPRPGKSATPPVAWRAVVGVASLILVYIIALPWFGFTVSSFVFATILLICYRMPWWRSLLTALLFVVGIRLLFIRLFEIYLPEGWLTEFWS